MKLTLTKFNLYPKICCEKCGNIVAHLFDCPNCGKWGFTDLNCDSEEFKFPLYFSCSNCKAKFKQNNIDISPYESNCEWLFKKSCL